MDPNTKIKDALKQAQQVFAEHVDPHPMQPDGRPRPQDCEETIDKLGDILDDTDVVQAVNESDRQEEAAGADAPLAPLFPKTVAAS